MSDSGNVSKNDNVGGSNDMNDGSNVDDSNNEPQQQYR